jgi:hydrogenase maturation protein HypF
VAVLAEHRIEEKALAVILDGSGLGDDNTLWGGEVLEVNYREYKRLGSLAPMLLPGGDAAAENPWRMGLSLLHHAGLSLDAVSSSRDEHATVWQLMEQQFNCPVSTSCGRVFDGVASLLGICQEMDYEGQAAMELESLAKGAMNTIPLDEHIKDFQFAASVVRDNGRLVLQQSEIVKRIVKQLKTGVNIAEIALDFHLSLIRSFFTLTDTLGKKTGLQTVVLSGGCMQNMLLQEGLFILLEQAGYTVYTGEKIPVNDGGIALGQAVIGGLAHVSGSTHESP